FVNTCSTTPSTCITSDAVDLSLNEIKLGNDMTTIPAVGSANYRFNGLQNSSIGNVGFKNASVTDLKMKISGL
ncbi:pilus assembly protein FilA, partial [Acinetobacter nosocomialis]